MQFETALWRLRLRFYWSIACVEAQIAMNALGIGEVDARRLLGTLERVQVYTLRICPSLEA
jgi:hypothetical protein